MDGRPLEPQNRVLGEMRPVLYDAKKVSARDSTILYRMYRDASWERDRQLFKENRIRFDVTIMASIELGPEPNKTLGHYHPKATGDLSYPEIYQVLSGNATFLLQKKEGGRISDFVVVEAKDGDAVLILPNYGHVTVNSGEGPLVLSNLVSDRFSSLYQEYIVMHGAAYYLLKKEGLHPNAMYPSPPAPRHAKKNFPVEKDLYTDFVSSPSSFLYLNEPLKLEKLDWL